MNFENNRSNLDIFGRDFMTDKYWSIDDTQAIVTNPPPVSSDYVDNKLILISLPASFDVANYILKFCNDNLPSNHHSNVIINYHPVLKLGPRNYITILKKYFDYEFSDNLFSELIINAGLVISNSSSTCIESLAFGVPVIILQGGSPINQNPIPNTIDKNMWDECDNNVDFYNAFKRLFIEKNILARSKAAKLIRKEYFEPVNTKSVNDFLEL